VRLPGDVSGDDSARRLTQLGHHMTRQTGSHLRVATDRPEPHHITIPRHAALRIGTLAAILAAVEAHRPLTRQALLDVLFD
jgi:predicted RNA binding protein YcfA (HicA-like mRNA interferase family)